MLTLPWLRELEGFDVLSVLRRPAPLIFVVRLLVTVDAIPVFEYTLRLQTDFGEEGNDVGLLLCKVVFA